MREKFDFVKIRSDLDKELKSVKNSPRALIVMFDAYMMSALTEIIALRFNSDVFSNKPESLRLEIALGFDLISKSLHTNIQHLKTIRNTIAHTPDISDKKFTKKIDNLIREIPLLKGGMFAEHFSEDFIESSEIVYDAIIQSYNNEREIYENDYNSLFSRSAFRTKKIKKAEKLWKLKGRS